MVQKIKSRLKQLANAVKDKIKREVHTVVELLKKRVRDIKMKLEGITASLEKYVKELGAWMGEAKKYINKVREYLNKIMQQLDGPTKREIDQAAADIDKTLSNKVGELKEWIEKADSAVQAAKDKAANVYGRLDKDDKGQKISQGIDKVNEANEKVSEVNTQLGIVHVDLKNWKNEAQTVLGIAIGNAVAVHTALDPTKYEESHIIGQKLKAIDDAKKELDTANDRLKIQVESLNKWIDSAEKIRAAAEQKAKEAYDKLSVHQELSKNVKKIMEAKNKIDEVNKSVNSHLGSLKQWNEQAKNVLDGAIKKAQDVHDRLKGEIVSKIGGMEDSNKEIIRANERLKNEVANLGKWNTAARKVIEMAEDKCDEIVKRVDKDHKENKNKDGPVILQEASKLKDQGTKLLTAAKDAKQKVEERVKSALEAVKTMDADIKKDLKVVKDEITRGITEVIKDLKVGELGDRVKEDLKALRGRIEGLAENGKAEGLVRGQLSNIDDEKNQLKHKTQEIKEQMEKNLVDNFSKQIKQPLDDNVKAVETAIGKLYGTINPDGGDAGGKKIKDVIGHIKSKVGDILKGENGRKDRGLQGIAKGLVDSYASGFKGEKFNEIVKGWIEESILKFNGVVWSKMSWQFQLHDDKFTNIAVGVRDKLTKEIDKGKEAFNNGAQGTSRKITENLTKVKEACERFADELDGKKTEAVRGKVDGIVGRIKKVNELHGNGTQNSLSRAEAVLCALSTAARQVSKEIQSILLDSRVGNKGKETSIAGELDRLLGVTQELDGKLEKATENGGDARLNPGTAQAVDNAIEGVKTEVGKVESNFQTHVRKPVEEAIQGLEEAVETFDEAAKKQVKAAAQGAIDKAAKVISDNGGSDIDLGSKMPNFHNAHEEIKSGLPKGLQALLDKHIGKDVPASQTSGGKGDPNVELADTFEKYIKHIGIGPSTEFPYRKLLYAIDNIRDEGMKGLEEIIAKYAKEKIDKTTFTDPFRKIGSQLDVIVDLITNKGFRFLGDKDESRKGISTLLNDLQQGIHKGELDGSDKGLDSITKAIGELQTKNFTPDSEAIGNAVQEIKLKVDELKKKLKSDNDGDKDAVINALTYFKDTGLASVTWNGKNGGGVDGLGKIESEFKRYNEELGKQPGIIMEAVYGIRDALARIKIKLNEPLTYDDVVHHLTRLEKKIGLGNYKHDGTLQGIHDAISELQNGQFSYKPKAIQRAAGAFKGQLNRLRHLLDKDVIKTLTDLSGAGLGADDWVKEKNTKGLEKIENDLTFQQLILNQQPQNIQDGITVITDELQSLRTELQGTGDDNPKKRGVIKNLGLLITQLGEDENKGLKKIKSEMESLKSQGKGITGNLGKMSLAIQDAGAYADWHLGQLENPHIDGKLRDIQSGLDNLRLNDLAAAIKMCDDFLRDADEIERNTIHALLKHVDDEVGDVIRDLTKEARGLYVDSVREALALFARKITEDLEQLPGDINHDMTIGFKGFMNTVEGDKAVNINKLKCVVSGELNLLTAEFASFFGTVNDYVRQETQRVRDEQNKERNPSLPPTEEPYTSKLNDVYVALTELLVYLRDNDDGTDKLTELVERLANALSKFVPSDFKHPSTPLLDTVSRGLTKFAVEFHNTYISTYSGKRCREEHAHKYAKVLLSIIPMTRKALTKLATRCAGEWKALHISKFTADDRDNALGNYLARCGYRVSSSGSGQDGELNNLFTGAGIHELLTTRIEDVAIEMMIDGEPMKNGINFVHITSLLYNVLCHYFQVCHIPVPPNPLYPCTVRDMLSWLSGLQYTQVADKLPEHCKALLNRRCHDDDIPNREDPVMAKCIGELSSTIATTCSHSTALLIAIQGNGHGFDLAAYPYSVDFSNNRARLHYPDYPDALLDMLREIACRLCKVLYFLYSQCCRSTARVKGWRECAYGRQVQSHNWQCGQIGTYSSTISTTTATTTSSTTTHGCPPTSPLQSFLSDSCQGLLPHILTAADMKIECANCTANQPGQRCLTPLGFWDIGFAASISGTGWDLTKRLGDMCRDADASLFVLCRTLFYLCPTAPSSLADVFAFYAQMLRKWGPHDRVDHRGGAYTDASNIISHLNTDGIDSLFPLWKELHGNYENNKLTTATASLTDHDHESHNGLSTLFNDTTCQSPSGCGPYLQPLGLHAHHTYPKKHAGLYITWIIYLAWQFWELLYNLLQALHNIDCTDSGCATCPCQPGTHGEKDTCQCPSLVHCAGPLPTLYRYGFTFRNANLLVTANRTMRCGDLNTQLKEALHSDHFTELFRQIDQLIWHIRMPLCYCLVALWSLVALYILHTFLYRLDIFHIRSHLLTTKASHLIDVKALLIPSRKMLSLYDASYFDDDPSELLDAT